MFWFVTELLLLVIVCSSSYSEIFRFFRDKSEILVVIVCLFFNGLTVIILVSVSTKINTAY